jgi:hypothetical protein
MRWRHTTSEDIPEIRRLWERAGYGFAFPDLESENTISSWVAEENGKIRCWSGAILQPEIVSIMDSSFGSPHERVKLFGRFHAPIAQDLRARGFERVFATLDPKYSKFGKRLAMFGWFRGWDYWFLMVDKVIGKK